jgi:hypothetical protein
VSVLQKYDLRIGRDSKQWQNQKVLPQRMRSKAEYHTKKELSLSIYALGSEIFWLVRKKG